MNWGGWPEFFAMGGYALYVWGGYAVVAVLVVSEIVFLKLRKRNILRHLGYDLRAESAGVGQRK